MAARMLPNQRRLCGIAGKVFSSKLQGEKEYSVELSDLLEPGEFDESLVLTLHVRGKKGQDGEGSRFFGVSHNDLFDYAIGFLPGFTEDNYRRLAAGAIELKRAELEERDVQDVLWEDSEGKEHKLTAKEIEEAVERAEERKERMRADADRPEFSKLVKMKVPQKGRVEFGYVEAKARQARPEEITRMEPLKQTKADAKIHGEIIPQKSRKNGKAK